MGEKPNKNVIQSKADIYLDGVFQTTIDTYDPSFQKFVLLWSITGLSEGTHTINYIKLN